MPISKILLIVLGLLAASITPVFAEDVFAEEANEADYDDPFAESEESDAEKAPEVAPIVKPIDGESIYRRACAACHGMGGNGDGPQAAELTTPPAAFSQGNYKFRSTPTSELPTDEDIMRTIEQGIPNTDMPAWKDLLGKAERKAVVEYLKSLSPYFADLGAGTPIEIMEPPAQTDNTLALGKEIYKKMECAKCHGETGRGDGPSSDALKDVLGRESVAYDFTSGNFHGGGSLKDIYRTFNTGMDGTPMPSYYASMNEEERWALVYYVRSLESKSGFLSSLFCDTPGWE